MKKIRLTKDDKRSIVYGLIVTLLLLLIPVISFFKNFDVNNALVTLSITQLGIASIWLIVRFGLFSTSSYGTRKYAKTKLHKKNNKIGVYEKQNQSKITISEYNSPKDIEEKSNYKSKYGIYSMFAFGVLELLITLSVIFI